MALIVGQARSGCYQSALAGTFDEGVLGARDEAGVSLREAITAFGLGPITSATLRG